jgi:hypothetical protein
MAGQDHCQGRQGGAVTDDEPMWKVFISHSSSKTQGVAAALRDLLDQTLQKPAYDVFLDRESLGPSDEWEDRLTGVLRDTHIGIVLLDVTATRSDWVQREISALIQKENAQRRVFPVLIGIRKRNLKRRRWIFKSLYRYNVIELTEETASAEIEKQAHKGLKEILGRLGEFPELVPGEAYLIKFLARQFGVDDRLASEVRNKHFPNPSVQRFLPFQAKEDLARQLIEARISMPAVQAIKAIASDINERKGHFVRAFEPTWLAFDQTQPLRVNGRSPVARTFVLYTDLEDIGPQYIRRANHCREDDFDLQAFPPWANGEATGPADDVDELFKDLSCAHEAGAQCDVSDLVQYVVVPGVDAPTMSVAFTNAIHRRCSEVVVLVLIQPGQLDDTELAQLFEGRYEVIGEVDPVTYASARKNMKKICEHLYV